MGMMHDPAEEKLGADGTLTSCHFPSALRKNVDGPMLVSTVPVTVTIEPGGGATVPVRRVKGAAPKELRPGPGRDQHLDVQPTEVGPLKPVPGPWGDAAG